MDELDQVRAARREANLRDVNERTVDAQTNGLVEDFDPTVRILCECSLEACDDVLEVPLSTFREARATDTRFIVRVGHVLHAIEKEYAIGDGWWIVEKFGRGARVVSEEA